MNLLIVVDLIIQIIKDNKILIKLHKDKEQQEVKICNQEDQEFHMIQNIRILQINNNLNQTLNQKNFKVKEHKKTFQNKKNLVIQGENLLITLIKIIWIGHQIHKIKNKKVEKVH